MARRRWVVEQAFGTLKRRFRGARSRYLTCRNVEAELTLMATVMNLLKAANRIDLVTAWEAELTLKATVMNLLKAANRIDLVTAVEAELTLKATVMNLLKAANRIDLVTA